MATLTVQPAAKDTLLQKGAPTQNSGSSADLMVQRGDDGANETVRSILEFDISSLPAGTTIVSATLSLYEYWINRTLGRTYWAYKLSRTDWVELEATWNIYKTANNWTVAGGDYVTSSPSGGSDTVPAAGNWMDFNVLAIVQDAYDASLAAEFLIRDATEGGGSGVVATLFRSSNYTTDTSLRPKLVIVYGPPTVTTQACTDVATTTATGNGNVTDLGEAAVTQHGHCWSTSADPTTADSKTELGAKAATGAFTSSITGLNPSVLYHTRAYAINSVGTAYGADVEFTTKLRPWAIVI